MQETKKRLKSLSSYINGTSSETLSRVKTPHNLPVEKVLKLYKSGYNIRLTEALGERYKSVWKCLGDEEFFLRCEEYIKHSPSTSYNLAEYGNAFPHFLEEKYLDSEFKFIGDIARVDLFFMELFHSRDDDCLDSENFFQLCQLASENFQFQHNIRIVDSPFSIFEIWNSIKNSTSLPLNDQVPEGILLFKNSSGIFIKQLCQDLKTILQFAPSTFSIEDILSILTEKLKITEQERISKLFKELAGYQLIKSAC